MIKIQFTDMWIDFDFNDNLVTKLLKQNSILFEFIKSPDLLFSSVFGFKHLNY